MCRRGKVNRYKLVGGMEVISTGLIHDSQQAKRPCGPVLNNAVYLANLNTGGNSLRCRCTSRNEGYVCSSQNLQDSFHLEVASSDPRASSSGGSARHVFPLKNSMLAIPFSLRHRAFPCANSESVDPTYHWSFLAKGRLRVPLSSFRAFPTDKPYFGYFPESKETPHDLLCFQ